MCILKENNLHAQVDHKPTYIVTFKVGLLDYQIIDKAVGSHGATKL